MTVDQLPALNAILNTLAAGLLLGGFVAIRRGRRETHRAFMLGAVGMSAAFLTSYLIYHAEVGSKLYPYHDWTRPVYFGILIPHVVLAGLMGPFILAMLWFAWRGSFDRHRRLARYVWPVWMFVSVSGVSIYLLLYRPWGGS